MVKFAGFLKRLKQAKHFAKNVIGTMKDFYEKAKPVINQVFKLIPDKYVGIADKINSAVDTGLSLADTLKEIDPFDAIDPLVNVKDKPAPKIGTNVLSTFNKPINV